MKRLTQIARDEAAMATLVELTSAFEGIASMRISKIKNQVLQSTKFFNELWAIYSQVHVEGDFNFGRVRRVPPIDKDLYIVITSEGGFSGDIDQKLIRLVMQSYAPDKSVVIVIGHHGATQLAQNHVLYKKFFKMPVRDSNINVMPIIKEVQQYRSTRIFYQEYVSLMSQDVKYIDLSSAVHERGVASQQPPEDIINEKNYIFEPSTYAVVAHLERSMMQIAVSQLILESKLAQYASRFRAMTAAHQRADESKSELHVAYNQAHRAIKDERLKETVNVLKKVKSRAGAS